jgi:hypothetical protein
MSNLITGDFPVKTYRNLSLGVTGQIIKAAKGQIFDLHICNQAAAIRYVKLYDKATAATASDTPVRTYAIPASTTIALPVTSAGIEYLIGIGIRGTTGVADSDTGAPAANDIVVNIGWM